MWNYSFAIPSFLILGILLVNFFTLQRLPLRMFRQFVGLMIIEAGVITIDIVSSWACDEYQHLPYGLVYFLNLLFFVLYTVRPYAFFSFTSNIYLRGKSGDHSKEIQYLLPMVVVELIVFTTPFTNLIFDITKEGFVRGPLYKIIEVEFAIYLLFCLIEFYKNYKHLKSSREITGNLLYISLLIAGLIMRQLFPTHLIMDTFCLMSIIVIDLIFMNPEYFIERNTRLFNSDGFNKTLIENDKNKPYNILAFTIKNYRELRDIYGTIQMDSGTMMIGDYLLREFSKQLCFYIRNGRFVIIFNSDNSADEIIETIKNRFKRPWLSKDTELYLDVGFVKVITNYFSHGTDVFINTLNNSLYIVELDNEDHIGIIDNDTLEDTEKTTELKRILVNSIEQNKVEIFLQPIIDAKTHQLVGAESLCRLRDAAGNIIPPAAFISLAESSGRINKLGEIVFEKTCKFIHDNDIKAMGLNWINVNLSTLQFLKTDLAESFVQILRKYDIDPRLIHLEITEASIIDESIMANQIRKMQSYGLYFVLDDYGTGYSNASRLKSFPFINIKIDMGVVWDYYETEDVILPAMITAFKNSNYTITAEGIENEKLADAMTQIGCDYLQGMYFSPPISTDKFIEKYSV
ncbi:MAG: EAL domain-containing protein [Pseudobutyrivibrio sp.]|nr:EAL domain-containing protein [Pseudobutyrivibrio sp.]